MKRVFAKKLSAAFLALVMLVSLVPTAAAASWNTITEYVDADEQVVLSKNDFKSIYDYDDDMYTDFHYVVFDSNDLEDLDYYGYFKAKDADGSTTSLYEDDMDNAWFYYYNSDVPDDVDYRLDGLTFVADEDAYDETLTLDFTLYGENDDDYVDGTLKIEIGDGYGSGSGDVDLEWEVEAGEELVFDEDALYELYDDNEDWENDDLDYIDFTYVKDLDYYGEMSAYDYDYEEYVTIDEDDLPDQYYYYYSYDDSDYLIEDLTFEADYDSDDGEVVLEFTMYGDEDGEVDVTLTITIGEGSGSGSGDGDGDINYEADSGDKVTFSKSDFKNYYDDCKSRGDSAFSYVEFYDSTNLDDCGKLYAYDYYEDSVRIYEDEVDEYYFYYSDYNIEDDETDLCLDGMYYKVDNNADDETVTLDFTVYGSSSSDNWDGTLTITIGNGGDDSDDDYDIDEGDISFDADAGDRVTFDEDDFKDFYDAETDRWASDFSYIVFDGSDNLDEFGTLYAYDNDDDKQSLDADDVEDYYYYYDTDEMTNSDDDWYLYGMYYDVDDYADDGVVTLDFTAYGTDDDDYAEGTLTIIIGDGGAGSAIGSYYVGSVRYNTTTGNAVQIKAEDISRFFSKTCPGFQLQYVVLTGVPSTGSLWYNYYGASKYGSAKGQITALNASGQVFYASPTSTSQYALTELTYIPSGTNYCAAIPFTAVGTGSRSVSGAILISVTSKAVGEVYSVTTKGGAVTFPSSSIYSAVLNATGQAPASIQLLNLPSYIAGAVYEGNNYSLATTTKHYSFGTGSGSVGQLRFIPSTGFTGSVEIPYVALNSNGTAIASGLYSIGVVSAKKSFTDVSSSTWCYKYVTELSDAQIIGGYNDGSFKPNNTITYGAALKLVMLAAGYPEQKPTNSNVFSGYLAKAKADGLVSGNVNLSKPITRLQIAQLAAKAMKLSTSGLSTVKPFTDTSDPYVQALNAAGIIGGYFANGTRTYKPNNNLTRGQVSAIVWRMENYNK